MAWVSDASICGDVAWPEAKEGGADSRVGCRAAVPPMKRNTIRMKMVKISSVVRRFSVPFIAAHPFVAAVIRSLRWLIVRCDRATLVISPRQFSLCIFPPQALDRLIPNDYLFSAARQFFYSPSCKISLERVSYGIAFYQRQLPAHSHPSR